MPVVHCVMASSIVMYCRCICLSQTVISNGEQWVSVMAHIDARDIGALIDHDVEKSGVLMGETIVVLPPYRRRNQQVQGRYRFTPRQVVANLQPLGVLVEHRIDHVYEGLVGGEDAVTSDENVTLHHALHGVLTQHLHHTAIGR